jgi:arginase
MKHVSLIPFACGIGASVAGGEQAVADLQKRNLAGAVAQPGLDIEWMEVPQITAVADKALALGSIERDTVVLLHCGAIRDQVEEAVRAGRYPITIGGDHSMAAGSVAGLAQALDAHGRIGLIWIDAHADINTPETSPSQALHGMPVAALLGMGHAGLRRLSGNRAVVKPENVFYLGLRDVDPGEWDVMDRLGIGHYSVNELRAMGVARGFAAALEKVSRGTDYIVISLDLDAFDPAAAPSVGSPAGDGFTAEEIMQPLAQLVRDARPAMMEIAEYNPAMGGGDKTYALIKEILNVMLAPLAAGESRKSA